MQFQKIKTNLSEMLAESTANGLPRIFKSKKIFFKIFWFSFFILGNIASFYYIIKAIDNYLVYDVISRRTTIYKNYYKKSFCIETFTFLYSGCVWDGFTTKTIFRLKELLT